MRSLPELHFPGCAMTLFVRPRKITKRDTTIYLFTSIYCKVQLFAYILIRHPAKLPNEIMNNIKDTTCTSNDVPTKIATSFLDIRL